MKITFNGTPIESESTTLSNFLQEQGFDANSHVATAVNGTFIPKTAREACIIEDGDNVEVVAPMQGG